MKFKWIRFSLLFCLIFFLTACMVGGSENTEEYETFPSQVLVGDVYILQSQERIDGDIVGFNTTLVIEEGASVKGDVILFGSKSEYKVC